MFLEGATEGHLEGPGLGHENSQSEWTTCKLLLWLSVSFSQQPRRWYYGQPRVREESTKAQRVFNDLPVSQGWEVVQEELNRLPGSRVQAFKPCPP